MIRKPKTETSKLPDQGEKFANAARELGCDESEAHFEEKLKQVARHKPTLEPPASKKPKTTKPAK